MVRPTSLSLRKVEQLVPKSIYEEVFRTYHHVALFVNVNRAELVYSSHLFRIGLWKKKERLIPQTPSIRGRSHSYLGGSNSKITITLFLNQDQEKNATLW